MSRKNRRRKSCNRHVTRAEGKYTMEARHAQERASADARKRICRKCEFPETRPDGRLECDVFHCPFGFEEESA